MGTAGLAGGDVCIAEVAKLLLPNSVGVFLCTAPVDTRRSSNGLTAAAQTVVCEDPLSRHLFVFLDRHGDRVKILYFDRDG